MKIKQAVVLVVIILMTATNAVSSDYNSPKPLASSAWFMPSLVENNDKFCEEILLDAQALFLSEESMRDHYFRRGANPETKIPGLKPLNLWEDNAYVKMEELSRNGRKTREPTIFINGNKFYLNSYTHPGCGGACEEYQLFVTKQPYENDNSELCKLSPPRAPYFQFYWNDNKSFWLYLPDEKNNLLTYKILDNGSWKKTCKVEFTPNSIEEIPDTEVQKAYNSLLSLKPTVSGLTRKEGNCGSSSTLSRWTRYFNNELPVVLYRPWSLIEDFASDSTYSVDFDRLGEWALMGISEYESYHDYLSRLDETIKAVAKFYQLSFAWDQIKSEKMARSAITTAVSTTIRFYMYKPIKTFDERMLRKSILEKAPMTEIVKLKVDFNEIANENSESLLSLAVKYPDALKYLLQNGLEVDHENEFGKTPLMYAVQYNQLESVKLLLDHGANPNSKTIAPGDTCNYDINTFGMTPLHYAVRYASLEVIKLLIDRGAVPFLAAENKHFYPASFETPLVWLERYTDQASEELNPNINDDQVDVIKKWLNTESDEVLSKKFNKLLLEAESLYQQGKILEAYRSLDLALSIKPDNERALSDMSLIALRNGKLGQSLQASQKINKESDSVKLKANAWFNQGLACAEHKRGTLEYNGNYYCKHGYVYPFYEAVIAYPTNARKQKIIEMFNGSGADYCELPAKDMKIHFAVMQDPEVSGWSNAQMIFVFHKSGTKISGDDLSWETDRGRKVTPKMTGEVELGDYTLSIFNSYNSYVHFPYQIMGHMCHSRSSVATKMPH